MTGVSDRAAKLTMNVRPDGVAMLTLDDAASSLGTWDEAFSVALDDVVDRLRGDARIRGAVLRLGLDSDENVHDARRLDGLPRLALAREAEQAARAGARALARLRAVGKPVVAAVHGPAVGAAFELALACSALVATEDARTGFGFPEVRIGLLPPGNGLLRVAERAGLRVALDLGLSGDAIDAATARRLGLVDELCPRAILLDVAIWRARTGPKTQAFGRRLASRSPLLRRSIVARARRGRPIPGQAAATARIIDVLERWARSGFEVAAVLEAASFGALVVSEASRRSVEAALAIAALHLEGGSENGLPRALTDRGSKAYAERLRRRYQDEAKRLVADGVSGAALEEAMVTWGWPVGLLVPEEPRVTDAPGSNPAREEIQMRIVLGLVNEALACLGEQVVRDARDGDVAAVLALGFPAFRGGPFRYVDAVGPAEILRRTRDYEARFGPRFTPAPALVERARTGERFYKAPSP